MADPVITRQVSGGDMSLLIAVWTLTTADNIGSFVEYPEYADRTFQVEGTFGGGTVVVEGTNSGTNSGTLSNVAGATPASWTGNGCKAIIELTRYMRPLLSGSVGATVTVTMLARRANPMRT